MSDDEYLDIHNKLRKFKEGDLLYNFKHNKIFSIASLPKFYQDIKDISDKDIILNKYINARKINGDWHFDFIIFLQEEDEDDEDDTSFNDYGMLNVKCNSILTDFILNSEYKSYMRKKKIGKLLENDTK